MRGGSWNNNPRNVRASNRNRNEPENRNNNIGFQCARDVERRLGLRGGSSGGSPLPEECHPPLPDHAPDPRLRRRQIHDCPRPFGSRGPRSSAGGSFSVTPLKNILSLFPSVTSTQTEAPSLWSRPYPHG
ncbi:MAG: hypothetical protein GY953_24920 [bacterium]|nr:hypothetical protein [bacterium]